jgi:hypothetical protein
MAANLYLDTLFYIVSNNYISYFIFLEPVQ